MGPYLPFSAMSVLFSAFSSLMFSAFSAVKGFLTQRIESYRLKKSKAFNRRGRRELAEIAEKQTVFVARWRPDQS
jgi:hypothetical protein